MILVLIEARIPGGEWATREHLDTMNWKYRNKQISMAHLIEYAERIKHGWSYIHPHMDFQVGVYNYADKSRIGGKQAVHIPDGAVGTVVFKAFKRGGRRSIADRGGATAV